MKKLTCLLALLLTFNFQSNAQLPLSRGQMTFGSTGEDVGYAVQQTTDGGYIITGSTSSFGVGGTDVYLIRINIFGDTMWTKAYGGVGDDRGNSVQQTLDGGYIIAGYTNSFGVDPGVSTDVYLIRTDANGDTLWTKTYGGGSFDNGWSVQQTVDAGYVIAGNTYSFGAGVSDFYLIKTDSIGDTLWTKTYGGSSTEWGRSVRQTADGGYIITGSTSSFGTGGDVYLVRTDSVGDTLWTRAYGGTSGDGGWSVQQTTDEGYIIAANTNSFGAGSSDVYLIKTDSVGDTLWTKTYGGAASDLGSSVQQTADGGYIITGNTRSFGAGAEDVYLIRTDSIGDTLWTKTFGGDTTDYGSSVQQTTDGGYVIAGQMGILSPPPQSVTIVASSFVFTPDSVTITEGDTVCFQGIDAFHPLVFTSDSSTLYTTDTCFVLSVGTHDFFCNNHVGIGMVGSIEVQPAPGAEVYFIKTDANGNSGGCHEGPAATVVTSPPTVVSSTATLTGSGAIVGSTATIVNGTATEVNDLVVSMILNSTNVSCSGLCDGTAVVSVSGGTPPYNYSWNTGQIIPAITGLCPGTYIITVTDTLGCSVMDSIIITEPDSIVLSISVDGNVSCNGGSDGGATVNILSGGISPYDYLWSSGDTTLGAFLGTNSVTGLFAGTYTVTVINANGCSETDSVTINEPLPLAAVILANLNISCNGNCDGEAFALVADGTPPYAYLWDDVLAQTTLNADSLCPGSYTLTATDTNGCTATDTVIITEPLPLTSSITDSTNITCFGFCDGTATVTPVGGTPPYIYQWNDPFSQTGSVAVGLCPGNYQVSVIDTNGCISISDVTLTQPSLLTSGITDSSNITCGFCDGTATVTPSGGTLPYTYFWADGQSDSAATGLCAGTISVIVTDTNGCSDTSTVTLTQPGGLTSGISDSANASCNGFCDGTATVTPSGGTPPYTYAWIDVSISDTIPGKTDSIIDSLCAGNYMAVTTDNNGCITTAPVPINEPTPLPIAVTVTSDFNGEDVSCNGACDGEATATPSGGTPPYTFLWDDPNAQTSSVADSLCALIYTVTVTDSNGCVSTANVTVTNPPPLPAPIAVTSNYNGRDISCNGASDGEATVSPVGGVIPYTYLWDDPNAQTDSFATGLSAGTYNVTVTDANGCNAADSITITDPPAMVLTTDSVADSTGATGKAWVTVNGGTSPYTYQWNTPPPNTNDTIFNLFPGVYTVVVTDANGCTDTADVTVIEITGISELSDLKNRLIVYPNPNTGEFMIEILVPDGVRELQIKITNAIGQVVYTKGLLNLKDLVNLSIDMKKYAKGIYDLEIMIGADVYTRKVIYQ